MAAAATVSVVEATSRSAWVEASARDPQVIEVARSPAIIAIQDSDPADCAWYITSPLASYRLAAS
jgi:hypothetical protein